MHAVRDNVHTRFTGNTDSNTFGALGRVKVGRSNAANGLGVSSSGLGGILGRGATSMHRLLMNSNGRAKVAAGVTARMGNCLTSSNVVSDTRSDVGTALGGLAGRCLSIDTDVSSAITHCATRFARLSAVVDGLGGADACLDRRFATVDGS